MNLPATPAELALHNNFQDSIKTAKRGILRAAFYLAQIVDRKVHRTLGYESGVDYAVATADLSRSHARDLLRMGRKLKTLPETTRAVSEGTLSWNQARALVGELTPENEREVLAEVRAERATPPDTRPEVPAPASPLRPSETPKPAPRPRPAPACRHIVTLSFDDEGYAHWEAAVALLRKSGRRETPAILHLNALQALAVAEQPAEPNHSSTLLVLLECPTCGSAAINTSRGELPAPEALLATAHCDAIVESPDASRRSIISPKLRRTLLRGARYRCQFPGCNHTRNLQIHHRIPHSHGGRTEASNLVVLCSRCHRALHEREADLLALRSPV